MKWRGALALAGFAGLKWTSKAEECKETEEMKRTAVRGIRSLGHGPMETPNPFLFCVYHKDNYPAGNDKMEVPGKKGDGMHFDPSASYRFYHGDEIPGFPSHPHRGFETITATIDGIIDHSDSLGNAGRYGQGDLQWMTAGKGVVHGENFPLIHNDRPNPTRFFQIWLNLPAKNKMVDPDFVMHWSDDVTKWANAANDARVTVWTGSFNGLESTCPSPKNSWAADKANDVTVLHISVDSGADLVVEPAREEGVNRFLYFVEGDKASIDGSSVKRADPATLIELDASQPFKIEASASNVEFLMLQGKPINEPVVQHGPFVMNSRAEIQQAFMDYQRTRFGGWPWKESAVVFPRDKGRFALLNGTEIFPKNNKVL